MTDHDRKRNFNKPAVRLCVAVDIEKYSRFRNLEAERVQERFIRALRYARGRAGLTAADVDVQRSGDGQFLVLPPGLDESAVIPAFVAGLSTAMRHTNAGLTTYFRLRLRVAMYRGLLKPGVNGWVGHSAIAVHRLLDSTSLRTALTDTPTATFALAVSDALYRDVIVHDYPGLRSTSFRRKVVNVPKKTFTEQAWIYLNDEIVDSVADRFVRHLRDHHQS